MISVLIADDNAVIRQGVRALLTAAADDIEVVGEAATGREAIEQAEAPGSPTSCCSTSACRSWTASRPPSACRASARS